MQREAFGVLQCSAALVLKIEMTMDLKQWKLLGSLS